MASIHFLKDGHEERVSESEGGGILETVVTDYSSLIN